MISRRFVIAIASLIFAAPACAQDLIRAAVGQRGGWDSSVVHLGTEKGIFGKHGIKLETLWTQGSGETLQAVISGAVDVGVAAGMAGMMAAFSKGAPLRPISNQQF